jgi:transposase
MEEGIIAMSKKELTRLEVVQRVTGRQMRHAEAAHQLSLSERQVKRLVRAFREEGAAGLVSKRRDQPSNNRIDSAIKAQVLERLCDRYSGFGPTLAAEYLQGDGFNLSKETLRGWMMEAGLWRAGKKRADVHPPRQRRPRLGELVQIDGSPHDWFEGRGPRCTLIAFIDDATSLVMAVCFTAAETTQDYLNGLHSYILAYGCPAALYSDRHGIFTKHDPEDAEPTQFQRATAELGIATLQALTPQAKGRVERLFQTLQDRLVKAMRLANISDMEAANAFLQTYLPEHNARFAVSPADDQDAHLPCPLDGTALARACTIQQRRKLDKNLTLSFRRQRYIIQTGDTPRYALRGQTVTVVQYPDGRIELLREAEILPFKVLDREQPIIAAVDDKTLNVQVDELLKQQRHLSHAKPRPHSTHPWRKPYNPSLLLAAQLRI